jgi:hypothetical protein
VVLKVVLFLLESAASGLAAFKVHPVLKLTLRRFVLQLVHTKACAINFTLVRGDDGGFSTVAGLEVYAFSYNMYVGWGCSKRFLSSRDYQI